VVPGAVSVVPRLRAALALASALLTLAVLTGAAPERASAAGQRPSISAPAAIVIDARTGERLYGRAPGARRSIASTTKLMTAFLTLARSRQRDVFTSPGYPGGAGESTIGLRAGERMSVHDLLRALLLPSANDAAYDLAVNIGGSQSSFVRAMNRQARALRLRGTHYSTPIGLDDPGNYSTAGDLARLAARLMRNPAFAAIVNLPSARLRTGARPRTVINRNDLVARFPFVDGVKTGHTNRAGYVLVGAAHGNGAQVVSVVLGTPSIGARDADSLALLRYGVNQFRRVRPVVKGRTFARAKVRYYDDRTVRLVASRNVAFTVRRGRSVRTRVDAPDELEGPLPAGKRVGSIQVLVRGRVAYTVPLVTATQVAGASFVRKATSTAGGWLAAVAFLALLGVAALVALRVRTPRGRSRGTASDDHHRHAQRRDRQDPRGAELPPRAPPPGGGADGDGRGQGRERRTRA
jgi:serine-type D-Ala-D-Ala carboxypeptidase (penicillin-binding protein 5/6)